MVITKQLPQTKQPIIRHKDFARRLEVACEGNPHCPTELYRGKQKWIYDGLEEEFGIKISSEAVRKWFSGESKPRPKVMTYLARLLEVDEGWLALGITPELTPVERKKRNAIADGAVNLVAGMIQMAGGHIAFPDDDSADIFAIIGGKNYAVDAILPFALEQDQFRLIISNKIDGKDFLAVVPQDDFSYRVLHVTPELVRDSGELRGDFWELVIEQRGTKWRAGEHQVRELSNIREIMLDSPRPPPAN